MFWSTVTVSNHLNITSHFEFPSVHVKSPSGPTNSDLAGQPSNISSDSFVLSAATLFRSVIRKINIEAAVSILFRSNPQLVYYNCCAPFSHGITPPVHHIFLGFCYGFLSMCSIKHTQVSSEERRYTQSCFLNKGWCIQLVFWVQTYVWQGPRRSLCSPCGSLVTAAMPHGATGFHWVWKPFCAVGSAFMTEESTLPKWPLSRLRFPIIDTSECGLNAWMHHSHLWVSILTSPPVLAPPPISFLV